MTINNVVAWYASDGRQEISNTDLKITGTSFPRKTVSTISASGVLLTGMSNQTGTPSPFTTGSMYASSFRQGSIIGTRTGIVEDRFSPNLRIWRIRKDFATADLRSDAADTYRLDDKQVSLRDVKRLRDEYKRDWIEWPAAKGAPYYDRNDNNIYDPKFYTNEFGVEVPDSLSDEPGLANADQVLWYVFNDGGNPSLWGSTSLGLEIQLTVWGYKDDDVLKNSLFKRSRIIFKGTASSAPTASLTQIYAGQWADIPLGQATDNYAGSDSLTGLGFVYNSKTLDNEYVKFSLVPPSVGYDILQTPVVVGVVSDSALLNFSFIKGKKNLPVSSITYTSNLNRIPAQNASGADGIANALKGLATNPLIPVLDPQTSKPLNFWSPGDPAQQSGWIDGVREPAGTRTLFVSSGPFSMAIGDTQEIVVGLTVGRGNDRLSSVKNLKFNNKIAQEYYTSLVSRNSAFPTPGATISGLDKTIIVEWEKDTASLNRIEQFNAGGMRFEGYHVFQLPTALSPRSDWKLVATFDLKNEFTQILEEVFNQTSGNVETIVRHFGTNSGISRYMILTNDSLHSGPLINGREYHFAVTGYFVNQNTQAAIRSQESSPKILSVVPQWNKPESVIPYSLNDTLTTIAEDLIGSSDGGVGVRILDPYAVPGGMYDIWYGKAGAANHWTVVKNISGTEYTTVSAALVTGEMVPRPNPLPNSSGNISFTLNDDKNVITYKGKVSSPNSVVSVEARIGPKSFNGTLAKTLQFQGDSIFGTWTNKDPLEPLTPEHISELTAGTMYIVVKTNRFPAGEIRGNFLNGMTLRSSLPIPDLATSSRSVFSFTENRFPNEGFSLFVAPAPIGYKSGRQVFPSDCNVINQTNSEGTFSLIGPGYTWGSNRYHESVIEFRFTGDSNRAITLAKVPAETKFIYVPFQVFKDSIRVVPVIQNTLASDSAWNIKGNAFLNGQPLFDNISGIADNVDFVGNDISYDAVFGSGELPTSNSIKGRLINGVNHIAQNITFVNSKGDGLPPAPGTIVRLTPYKTIKAGDIKRITLRSAQHQNKSAAKQKIDAVNVFPNPYYGVNTAERDLGNKYITFSRLPKKAKIKIYNLAGIHVRTLLKNTPDQFLPWDLKNQSGNFVASGVYLAYVDMEGIGTTVLKIAVIMEQQQINSY